MQDTYVRSTIGTSIWQFCLKTGGTWQSCLKTGGTKLGWHFGKEHLRSDGHIQAPPKAGRAVRGHCVASGFRLYHTYLRLLWQEEAHNGTA